MRRSPFIIRPLVLIETYQFRARKGNELSEKDHLRKNNSLNATLFAAVSNGSVEPATSSFGN